MSADGGFLACIASAEGHIRNAHRSWNPASLTACAECSDQLRQAIDAMSAAGDAAALSPAPAESHARLDRLRGDVEALMRLVDAALAFNRGLALRTNSEPVVSTEVTGIAHV